MKNQKRSSIIRTAAILATAQLWVGAGVRVLAQGSALSLREGPAGAPGVASVAPALRASAPRLHLTRMEHVGPRGIDSLSSDWLADERPEMAVASATQALLDRLTGNGHRNSRILLFARQVSHLADAPNRALCRLTGADRAHFNLQKRRVSFTWFVSW